MLPIDQSSLFALHAFKQHKVLCAVKTLQISVHSQDGNQRNVFSTSQEGKCGSKEKLIVDPSPRGLSRLNADVYLKHPPFLFGNIRKNLGWPHRKSSSSRNQAESQHLHMLAGHTKDVRDLSISTSRSWASREDAWAQWRSFGPLWTGREDRDNDSLLCSLQTHKFMTTQCSWR